MFSNDEINYKRYSGLGDFGKGFNVSSIVNPFSSVVRAVASPVTKAVQKVSAPIIRGVTSVVSSPLKAITTAVSPVTALTSGLNKAITSVPVVGNVIGTVEKGAASLVSKIPVIGAPVSTVASSVLNIPGSTQNRMAANQNISPIYQDAEGNVITKAQYDQLMSQTGQPTTVYQDAEGNVITEAQYNTLMNQQGLPSVQSSPNQMNYAPMYQSPSGQILQPTESQVEPDNSDQSVSTAPTLDPLSQKVYDALAQIQVKIAAGQSLTKQENDFVVGINDAMKSNQSLLLIPNVTPVQTSVPKSFSGDFEWKMEGFGGLGTLPSFNRQRINFKGVIR